MPPAISGVGDYALLLARELRQAHDIHTRFVVCDTHWKPEDGNQKSVVSGQWSVVSGPSITLDGFPIYHLKERSAEELLRVFSAPGMPETVLLQYAGYGYEKRGCPLWLLRGLEKWRNQKSEVRSQKVGSEFQLSAFSLQPERRLVTMFHELYAFGQPWRSSFWTSPLQKWIVKSLACSSGHCFTNLQINAEALRKLTSRADADFTVMPVLSNVGEPERLPAWEEREPKMIIFGNVRRRRTIYSEHKTALEKACLDLGLTEIVDIGPPCEIPQLSVRCRPTGSLPAQEVSREMFSARAGFFALIIEFLGKSSIFAAYAAHGLVPVTYAMNKNAYDDGLKSREHFVTMDQLSCYDSNQIQQVGANARAWYHSHDACEQAASYARVMQMQPSAWRRPS
ncbi:MAG: hypothetical protein ABR955_11015 [Verrucomicrobiota bacterium]